MHLTAFNSPLRTAVLSGRVSSIMGPIAYPSSASQSSPFAAVEHKCPFTSRPQHQKRAASTKSVPQPTLSARRVSPPQQALVPKPTTSNSPTLSCIRAASTQTASSWTKQNTAAAAESGNLPLDWNSFFRLRASRRRYSLVSSIVASIISTGTGVQVIATQNIDALGAQIMGFDPFIVLGLATAACGALGWLIGPVVGNGLWKMVHRKYKASVATKEKEFFDRIKRFRVDPSANSFANPVPDYYGEKIGSVQGYRQWLKDQRAYNRKKRNFV